MKKHVITFMIVLCTFFSGIEVSAQGIIAGKITDKSTGESLIGASVLIKGTTTGNITDLDGYYKIDRVASGSRTIVISSVGYKPQTIDLVVKSKDTTYVNVAMIADVISLEQVVVTGTVNPKSALKSSISVTTLQPKALEQLGAINTAEIFKSIPGVHSEATGGEGNANISVRGVPISTGGSKFLQLHEDGLPVMQFGDISFGNADIFLRSDQTISRVEAIRGGSASTFASNSPAGIINFISKNGSKDGGSIGSTFGLTYRDFRTDFEYGGHIAKDLRFDIGGFYRVGSGPRNVGYDGNIGGQIKANITKDFEHGYVRLYFKHLDDRAASYMPMPVTVSGTGSNPTFTSIPGFDLHYASLQSPDFYNMTGVDAGGNIRNTNIKDGMHPVSNAVGTEFSFDLPGDWKITNKNRLAFNNGSFRTLFPMEIGSASSIASSIAGSGATLSYVNGANAGVALTSSQLSNLNGNGLLMKLVSFDVDINSLNNFTNDLYLSRKFNNVNVTAGYYKAYQQIAMTWFFNTYLTDVRNQPRLLNVSSSTYSSQGGVLTYGTWNVNRKYDMEYDIDAPYLNVGIDVNDNLNVDASARYDFGNTSGYCLGNSSQSIDVNKDGVINSAERSVAVLNNNTLSNVGYTYGYFSYSLGANLKIGKGQAIYGRFSRGGRANADRLLYSSFIDANGKVNGHAVDMVTQAELGYKYNGPTFALAVTPFYSYINEQNYEATSNKFFLMGFKSFGAEIESSLKFEHFMTTAGVTLTHARIDQSNTASEVGNTPRRVPFAMYNLNPSYNYGNFAIGISMIGTTNTYSQNDDAVVLPAFVYFNGFASYNIAKGLSMSASINNIFNTLGFTEMESDTFTSNKTNYMRARPITGRTGTLSVTYKF
jgi:Outer membrane receptor proteins, mostly Fe transport